MNIPKEFKVLAQRIKRRKELFKKVREAGIYKCERIYYYWLKAMGLTKRA